MTYVCTNIVIISFRCIVIGGERTHGRVYGAVHYCLHCWLKPVVLTGIAVEHTKLELLHGWRSVPPAMKEELLILSNSLCIADPISYDQSGLPDGATVWDGIHVLSQDLQEAIQGAYEVDTLLSLHPELTIPAVIETNVIISIDANELLEVEVEYELVEFEVEYDGFDDEFFMQDN